MDQAQDFKSLQDQIQATLVSTTRSAGQISSEDLAFQRSLNPEVGTALDEQSARLLELASSLLKSAASIADLSVPKFEDADDVDNNWRGVVDVVDSLLEKTDTCLDEYTGVIKRKEQPEQTTSSKLKKNPSSLGNSFRTQNLLKPQLGFNVKPNNFDNSPWKPLLTTKPHATVPLEDSLDFISNDFQQQQYDYTNFLPLPLLGPLGSDLENLSKKQRRVRRQIYERLQKSGSMREGADNRLRYRQPYEAEILNLKYPGAVYEIADPIPYTPVETTSATFVNTFEDVLEMLSELKSASEIAVDLEHHDARSYIGLVSLMQISTRNKDWIVDTLKPWRQDLQVLNEVFADPNIIKVFHGAYMDIVWLQRDLGLYVVGLFDTHWGSRILGYQGGSLAFLLKKFIGFDADKKYQMADWRIRPIPEEMFYYARADTHYLLYIYDNMRNELISRSDRNVPEENRIEMTLEKSKETSLLRYERQIYNEETGKGPGGWFALLAKTPALFNNEQFAVFRAVHKWRDDIARKDDDSTAFIMPNHVIFSIARLMPTDMVALLGTAQPISHSVKSRAGELLAIIKAAKAAGKDGPSMADLLRNNRPDAISKAITQSTADNTTSKTDVTPVDQSQLRSEKSAFWGGAFGSSLWDAPGGVQNGDALRLAVPLPQLALEIFDTSSQSLTDRSRAVTEVASSDPEVLRHKEDEDSVAIKGLAKRKSDAISETAGIDETREYDILLNDEEEQKARDKAAKKAARRAEKKAEKAARKKAQADSNDSAEVDDEDDEPFDYSKAEPLLHGKRNMDHGSSKRKKPFDPYQKSADAPKGMRRLQTERPGKSFTFKS